MDRPEAPDHLLRVTPLTYALVVALAMVLAFYYWPGREAARNAATEQTAIETIVKENNDFAASIQALKDEVRVSLDPLTRLLEYDRRLKEEGLPPLSAKEFAADLSAANEKLIASGSEEYIDTCEQKTQLEMHLLYQGLRGPVRALPGWTPDWQTRCITLLQPPTRSPGAR